MFCLLAPGLTAKEEGWLPFWKCIPNQLPILILYLPTTIKIRCSMCFIILMPSLNYNEMFAKYTKADLFLGYLKRRSQGLNSRLVFT